MLILYVHLWWYDQYHWFSTTMGPCWPLLLLLTILSYLIITANLSFFSLFAASPAPAAPRSPGGRVAPRAMPGTGLRPAWERHSDLSDLGDAGYQLLDAIAATWQRRRLKRLWCLRFFLIGWRDFDTFSLSDWYCLRIEIFNNHLWSKEV